MAGGQQESVIDMDKCKTAVFSHSVILCKAGLNEKPMPMVTCKHCVGSKVETFVKMAPGEQWLCKAVTGCATAAHTSFNRTSLLKDLLAHAKRACDGEIAAEDAVVTAENEGEEDDPMDKIDAGDIETETPTKPVKKGRKRARLDGESYAPNAARNKIVVVEHRQVPEEIDPNDKALRKITLLVWDRRTVWLALADVDWAVKYLYAQNQQKGVGHVPADSTGPGTN